MDLGSISSALRKYYEKRNQFCAQNCINLEIQECVHIAQQVEANPRGIANDGAGLLQFCSQPMSFSDCLIVNLIIHCVEELDYSGAGGSLGAGGHCPPGPPLGYGREIHFLL